MNRLSVNLEIGSRLWLGAACLVAVFGLLGCGTLTAIRPIGDVKSLAGKWEGSLAYQRAQYGGTYVGATWIIREDGTYDIVTPRWRASGTLRVDDGRIFFNSDFATGFYSDGLRASGIGTLHEDKDGKYLLSSGHPDVSGYWWPAN